MRNLVRVATGWLCFTVVLQVLDLMVQTKARLVVVVLTLALVIIWATLLSPLQRAIETKLMAEFGGGA